MRFALFIAQAMDVAVLVECLTPSSRGQWRTKRLIIGYLVVPSFDNIKPDNRELITPAVHETIADFQVKLQKSPGTRPEAAAAYLEEAHRWLFMQV